MKKPIIQTSICLFFILFFLPRTSDAQIVSGSERPGLELRLFRPAVDSKGLFSLNASPILPHLGISFGLVLDYGYGVLRLSEPFETDRSLVQHSIWGTLHFNLGLFNRAVIGIQVPVGVNFGRSFGQDSDGWGGDIDGNAVERGWQASMVGDVSLHGKFRFIRRERFPVGLAAVVQLQFMSGDAPGLLGDPGQYGLTAITAQAIVDGRVGRRMTWTANLGYRLVLGQGPTIEIPGGEQFEYDDQITFGVGLSLNLIRNRLDLVGEFYGNTPITTIFDWNSGGLPMELSLGLKIFVERNSYLYLGVGTGVFSPGYSAAAARAFAAWVFEPSIGDRDGDGIKDDVDQCPNEPEDFDEFLDSEGCPDPDNDRDGILDIEDDCPFVPENRNGIDDHDGCPEVGYDDRDGDGIVDEEDQCPDDPEDLDQFDDEDGCSDPDNDSDGILDVDDLCPNDPEDDDDFDDEDGCPDPDNDEDRIMDTDDECPNRPEIYNGINDGDGCPDGDLLEVSTGVINVLEAIQFMTDSAEIREASFTILETIASYLLANPDVTLIEIQGHADERGDDDYNIRLTNDRANAVMNHLITIGHVDASRLRAAGYGERCPIDTRHNQQAWSRNRRVEFKILERNGQPTGVEIICAAGRDLMPED